MYAFQNPCLLWLDLQSRMGSFSVNNDGCIKDPLLEFPIIRVWFYFFGPGCSLLYQLIPVLPKRNPQASVVPFGLHILLRYNTLKYSQTALTRRSWLEVRFNLMAISIIAISFVRRGSRIMGLSRWIFASMLERNERRDLITVPRRWGRSTSGRSKRENETSALYWARA